MRRQKHIQHKPHRQVEVPTGNMNKTQKVQRLLVKQETYCTVPVSNANAYRAQFLPVAKRGHKAVPVSNTNAYRAQFLPVAKRGHKAVLAATPIQHMHLPTAQWRHTGCNRPTFQQNKRNTQCAVPLTNTKPT
jgi:hypothetical protein